MKIKLKYVFETQLALGTLNSNNSIMKIIINKNIFYLCNRDCLTS